MEDKQMLKHSFFSKIGAFSIDLNNPRSALQSLRFAIESMNRDRGSLYIYPEGELTPVSDSKPVFKKGLAWLYKNMKPKVDFVPIAFYTQTLRDSKPELYINVGSPLDFDRTLSKEELTAEFEMEIYLLLQETRTVAGFTDKGFVKV